MSNSSRRLFGHTKDGRTVEILTLDNGVLSCEVITFGAALRSLHVPDRTGNKRDVVLGYDTLDEYETRPAYLGAVVGRVATALRVAGLRWTVRLTHWRSMTRPTTCTGAMSAFLTESGLLWSTRRHL